MTALVWIKSTLFIQICALILGILNQPYSNGIKHSPSQKNSKPMPKIENNDLSDFHYEDCLLCIESADLVSASEICGMHTLTSLIKKVLSRKNMWISSCRTLQKVLLYSNKMNHNYWVEIPQIYLSYNSAFPGLVQLNPDVFSFISSGPLKEWNIHSSGSAAIAVTKWVILIWRHYVWAVHLSIPLLRSRPSWCSFFSEKIYSTYVRFSLLRVFQIIIE